jgi:anti-anti-sigma factor
MAAEPAETKTILLTGPITLYEVSAVRESLRLALADANELRIDLRDAGPLDLAGLQLLVSCVKTAQKRDAVARLINVPKICADIADRTGLTEWLHSVEG